MRRAFGLDRLSGSSRTPALLFRSDAGAGRIGLDGSARANRNWRRHVKGEDHGWLRNCPLMAMLLANSLSCLVVSAHWEPDAIPSTRTT